MAANTAIAKLTPRTAGISLTPSSGSPPRAMSRSATSTPRQALARIEPSPAMRALRKTGKVSTAPARMPSDMARSGRRDRVPGDPSVDPGQH